MSQLVFLKFNRGRVGRRWTHDMVQADGSMSAEMGTSSVSIADKQKKTEESLAALQRLVDKLRKEASNCKDADRRAKLNAQARQLGTLNAQLRSPLAEQVRTVHRSIEQLKQLQNARGGSLNPADFELSDRGELQLVQPEMRKQPAAANLASSTQAAPQKPARKSRQLPEQTAFSDESAFVSPVTPPATETSEPQFPAVPSTLPPPLPQLQVEPIVDSRPRDMRSRIADLAAGRDTRQVQLTRRAGEPLGFSVAGFTAANQLGVFVQDVVPGGIADRWVIFFPFIYFLCLYGRPFGWILLALFLHVKRLAKKLESDEDSFLSENAEFCPLDKMFCFQKSHFQCDILASVFSQLGSIPLNRKIDERTNGNEGSNASSY